MPCAVNKKFVREKSMSETNQSNAPARGSLANRMLATVERVGNKLPDPSVLFIAMLFIVWLLSWLLSYITFSVVDPPSGGRAGAQMA